MTHVEQSRVRVPGPAVKAALISMESRCGQAEENLRRICAYIARAGSEGARLAVFPELALTGYCLRHADTTALPLSHPFVAVLSRAAQENGVTALVGMAERTGETLWASQLVCGLDGTVEVYRKTHLGIREQPVFTPGDCLPVFDGTPPFGILLCYDMHFPEAAAALRTRGAELIAVPHAVPVMAGERAAVWARYMPARAYDNRMYVLCCNACGENGCGTAFSGGVAVYDPDGHIAAADFSGRETLLIVELKPIRFDGAKDFPSHRRSELYI